MSYESAYEHLGSGGSLILDGANGSELERRGVAMNAQAWCGMAANENFDELVGLHRDYIDAGADIVTTNTFATSRLLLEAAGVGDQTREINLRTIEASLQARQQSGRADVLVAGSMSHMIPMNEGATTPDLSLLPSAEELKNAFGELAEIHKEGGVDLILPEMMYAPDRAPMVIEAALATGLPVWCGFTAKRNSAGEICSLYQFQEIPFDEQISSLCDERIHVAGAMHTPSDLMQDANDIVRQHHGGPLLAYPDSGYFKMPGWVFEDIISPEDFAAYAREWASQGTQVIGGCCGLGLDHVRKLSFLRELAA